MYNESIINTFFLLKSSIVISNFIGEIKCISIKALSKSSFNNLKNNNFDNITFYNRGKIIITITKHDIVVLIAGIMQMATVGISQ